ncbi:MAG: hypothetical protein K9M07_06470 [Simkaniaceae bacterium]|nr:hypothetical protein [Simkaniaceae bacterium]MCF7852867.1 hypothetical protein [Simkaniaceae bacterium]
MTKDRKTLSKPLSEDIFTLAPIDFNLPKERHSSLFFSQGELLLAKGDPSGLEFFSYAESLDPDNFQLFFDMGLSIANFGDEQNDEKLLLAANKKFKAALKINPKSFEASHAISRNLYHLGLLTGKFHYFLEAKEKFKKALDLSDLAEKHVLYDLYIEIASNMLEIARKSGEICDFNVTLESFNQAKEMFPSHSFDFWIEFGEACLEMAYQIDDEMLYIQAIDCFATSIKLNPNEADAWFFLAISLKKLYFFTHDEDHFSRSNDCFSSCAKINPKQENLWAEWAEILVQSGKQLSDIKRLSSAIEKCKIAQTAAPKDEYVAALWSEALSYLGVLHDNMDYLHEAENKILGYIDEGYLSPETLYAHGICLFSFAKYFNDIDYYYQAIEKFQEGLSIDRTYDKLWFAIGHTYAIAAGIENDEAMFKQAISFFKKAIHLKTESIYLYEMGLTHFKLHQIDGAKATLQVALFYYEQAISKQKNAVYLHPEWLFQYAIALDAYADQTEDDAYYVKAIEILTHVLLSDPDHPDIHHKLALVYSHFAELTLERELYQKSLFHYQIAAQNAEENDLLLLDWALTMVNFAEALSSEEESLATYIEAEYKMIQAAKLGNVHAYYHLSCLYSILRHFDKAMHFIQKAQEFDALPHLDDILEDVWLENLREQPEFQSFVFNLDPTNSPSEN